nr:membrane protein, putative [Vibrio sp. FF_307]
MNTVWLHQSGQWQTLETPFNTPPEILNPTLKLTEEQWQRFQDQAWQVTLLKTLETHMLKWFPERCQHIDELSDWVHTYMETAYAKGFETEQDLLYYFNIIGYLGEEALLKSPYPSLTLLMDTPSLQTPSQRIAQAASLAEQIANKQKESQA